MFACVRFSRLGWLRVVDDEYLGQLGPHWGGGEAILGGLKKRHWVAGTVPILVRIVRHFAPFPRSPADPAGIVF